MKILVVDDNETVRLITSAALSAVGHEVHAPDFHGAFEFPQLVDDLQPDVVLIDEHMPGLRGRHLVKMAKGRSRHLCAVLLYSGATSEQELASIADEHGADGFIMKTDDTNQLVAAVADHCDKLVVRRESLRP